MHMLLSDTLTGELWSGKALISVCTVLDAACSLHVWRFEDALCCSMALICHASSLGNS